ncbi:MAG: hypothetical protein WB780_12765 [Candidatus Acidiferrales bacterium]
MKKTTCDLWLGDQIPLRVAIIGEGQTEYYCVPKLAGRCGHVVIGSAWIRMVNPDFDWERLFELRVVPLVMAMLLKNPDKIVVIIDKEDRVECPAELAQRGLAIIQSQCGHCVGNCAITVVISNKSFECLLFADYEAVDKLPILRAPVSQTFPPTTNGQSVIPWIKSGLKPGSAYHKIRDGMFLAQRIDYGKPEIQGRCRSLRKLVRELT